MTEVLSMSLSTRAALTVNRPATQPILAAGGFAKAGPVDTGPSHSRNAAADGISSVRSASYAPDNEPNSPIGGRAT
jgi:hypothetical protein